MNRRCRRTSVLARGLVAAVQPHAEELTAKLDTKVDNVAWKEAGCLPRATGYVLCMLFDKCRHHEMINPARLDAFVQANDDLDAAIKTVRDMVSSLRLDVDARRRKAA